MHCTLVGNTDVFIISSQFQCAKKHHAGMDLCLPFHSVWVNINRLPTLQKTCCDLTYCALPEPLSKKTTQAQNRKTTSPYCGEMVIIHSICNTSYLMSQHQILIE
jgi:hypothetical protein